MYPACRCSSWILRHNRDFMRAHGAALAERFPVAGRRALELLHAGIDPGGNSIVIL